MAVHCSLGEDAVLIRSVAGSEQLGRCFEYVLTLYSPDPDLKLDSLLGQHVTVEAKIGSDPSMFIDGVAYSYRHAGSSGRYALYQLTIRPWLWALSTNRECRVFQRQSVPEIVQRIFKDWGFSDFEDRTTSACAQRDYCVQYAESDLDFVSRLLEDEGIYFFFRHELGKHTLVFADSAQAHEPTAGYEQLHLSRLADPQSDRSLIAHWSGTTQVRPSRFSLNDYDFTKPAADLGVGTEDPDRPANPRAEVYEYPGGYSEVTRGQDRARVRLEEILVAQTLSEGTTHGLGVHAGAVFALVDHPRADQNKQYLVLSAHHQLDAGSFESGDASQVNFSTEFKALDSQTPFRPWRVTKAPLIAGPQTATIVGPSDQEIWTDQYGRVKVQFHWDRDGKFNEDSSCWVRVAQLWAGGRWGAMHIPRIGQEVVVEFLEGNPDQPLITGRIYNGKNMPPYDLPANQTQSGIKSRSTKGANPSDFNELRFEDKKGEEEVFLQAEKNLRELVKNDHHTNVGANQSNDVKKDQSETVGGEQTLKVTGNRTVHIEGSQSVVIDGSKAADGVSGSKVNVTGDYKFDASKTINIQAPVSIKLECGGSSILIEPTKISIIAGGQAVLVLDTGALMQAAGGAKLNLDTNALAQSALGAQLTLDANALVEGLQSTMSGHVLAQTVSGASSVKADPSGITVVGAPMVKIN
jgi:type VI secretion system secreted protein VgrG